MDRAGDVRRLREVAGLQVSDVAQKAGISRNYLSLLEGGKRPLSLDLYATILGAINDLREEREQAWQDAVATVGGGPAAESQEATA